MRTGIAVYDQSSSNHPAESFASDMGHALLDLDYRPKRFDVVEVRPSNLFSANGVPTRETLLSIKHGLAYVPRVTVFFYVKDAEYVSSYFQPVNGYQPDGYFWYTGANPQDSLFVTVDNTYLKVIHSYVEASSGGSTSVSALRLFDIKYLILSLKGPTIGLPSWA